MIVILIIEEKKYPVMYFPCKALCLQTQINHQRRHPSVLFEHALMFYYNTKPLSSVSNNKKSSALKELKWRSRRVFFFFFYNFILFCARRGQGSDLRNTAWVNISELYSAPYIIIYIYVLYRALFKAMQIDTNLSKASIKKSIVLILVRGIVYNYSVV